MVWRSGTPPWEVLTSPSCALGPPLDTRPSRPPCPGDPRVSSEKINPPEMDVGDITSRITYHGSLSAHSQEPACLESGRLGRGVATYDQEIVAELHPEGTGRNGPRAGHCRLARPAERGTGRGPVLPPQKAQEGRPHQWQTPAPGGGPQY